jgi:DNA/RNA-binding domain of Phe-tRNA-synthetase-like protein
LTLSSINFVVDVCNAVSLHSGLPISVVDEQLLAAPLRIAIAEPGSSYVFNASGQVIDVGGLVCLHDQSGPCANAVKDAQRAKTRAETTETLSVIWGAAQVVRQLDDAVRWYRELLERHGAATTEIVTSAP